MKNEILEEKLLTVKEICDFLRISDSTLRRYLEDVNFPRVKVGGEYRFYKSKVMLYWESK
jgi:excisionase family DNA binding protein